MLTHTRERDVLMQKMRLLCTSYQSPSTAVSGFGRYPSLASFSYWRRSRDSPGFEQRNHGLLLTLRDESVPYLPRYRIRMRVATRSLFRWKVSPV
jgi:hypothetical protein